MKNGREYNWNNWKIGDRVKMNPEFEWSHDMKHYKHMRGEVVRVSRDTLKVLWDDGLDSYYSYADSSLIKLNKIKIDILPDSLFEI